MAPPRARPSGQVTVTTPLDTADMLRAMRDVLGLSQERFAERVGLQRQQISAYENRRHSPSLSTLAEIAEKAGIHIAVAISRSPAAQEAAEGSANEDR